MIHEEICLAVEQKLRKKAQPGNLTRQGVEPGPARWQATMSLWILLSDVIKFQITLLPLKYRTFKRAKFHHDWGEMAGWLPSWNSWGTCYSKRIFLFGFHENQQGSNPNCKVSMAVWVSVWLTQWLYTFWRTISQDYIQSIKQVYLDPRINLTSPLLSEQINYALRHDRTDTQGPKGNYHNQAPFLVF